MLLFWSTEYCEIIIRTYYKLYTHSHSHTYTHTHTNRMAVTFCGVRIFTIFMVDLAVTETSTNENKYLYIEWHVQEYSTSYVSEFHRGSGSSSRDKRNRAITRIDRLHHNLHSTEPLDWVAVTKFKPRNNSRAFSDFPHKLPHSP
jgi:hypothetical protein